MNQIKNYYKQLQYNVLQTAIDEIPSRKRLLKAPTNFNNDCNLTSEIMMALNKLGYQITKIPKK